MFGLGTWEIAIILLVALLVLGPDRLPALARTIGKGLREMRRATNDLRLNLELDDVPPRSRPVSHGSEETAAAPPRPDPYDLGPPAPSTDAPVAPLAAAPAAPTEDAPTAPAVEVSSSKPAPQGAPTAAADPDEPEPA